MPKKTCKASSIWRKKPLHRIKHRVNSKHLKQVIQLSKAFSRLPNMATHPDIRAIYLSQVGSKC